MPDESIPYAALSYADLRVIYRKMARERGLAGNCGNPTRVKLVERIALLRTRPKIVIPPKPAKPPKSKAKARALTIQATAVRFLCEVAGHRKGPDGKMKTVGHSYNVILKMIRAKHRNSKTTPQALRGVASKIRHGGLAGTLPDIRLEKDDSL